MSDVDNSPIPSADEHYWTVLPKYIAANPVNTGLQYYSFVCALRG